MDMKIWILASIVILAIVLVILVKQGKIRNKPNYYNLFIVGIMWIAVGIPTGNEAFTVPGMIFTLIGLLNRSKWKEHQWWDDLSEEEKKNQIIIILVVGFLFIAGMLVYLFYNSI